MKIKLLILLFALSSFSTAGIHTGNGGFLSENNLIYVWQNLSEFCAETIKFEDGLSQDQTTFLKNVRENLHREPKQLQFLSSSLRPQIFRQLPNGQFEKFFTHNTIGSDLYFNLDEIYKVDQGIVAPLDKLDAFLLVLQALSARYQPAFSHQQLSENISRIWNQKVQRVNFTSYQRPEMGLEVTRLTGQTRVFVTDSDRFFDISKSLTVDAALCPSLQEAKNLVIGNLHYTSFGKFHLENRQQEVEIKASINYDCGEQESYQGKVSLYLIYQVLAPENSQALINHNWRFEKALKTKLLLEQIQVRGHSLELVHSK